MFPVRRSRDLSPGEKQHSRNYLWKRRQGREQERMRGRIRARAPEGLGSKGKRSLKRDISVTNRQTRGMDLICLKKKGKRLEMMTALQ